MRKKFNTFKPFRHLRNFLALCLVMVMTVGLSWGQTTVTWPGTTALPGTATAVANDQNVTIMVSSTNNYSNPIRIYANTTITINALNGAKILSVAYEASSTGNYVTYAQNATVNPNVTPTVSSKTVTWTYTESANVTEFTFTPSAQTRSNGISITYKTSGDTPQPTTYTVTYDCNGGTSECPDNVSNITAGTNITLASAPSKTNYTFDGWNDGTTNYDAGDSYTVNGDVTMTAQWTENADPSGIAATLVIEDYADANNWTNGTQYTSAVVQPITFTASGGGNTGKYYTSGEEWRYYQSENASITISVPDGYTLVSVTPAYNVANTGVLKNGNNTIASGSTVAVSGTSVTFTVGNSGTATNGQVKFTRIGVTYEPLTPPAVATPTFNPASGAEFGNEGLQVTISCETTSASIYYTLDGSTPDNNSTLYSGAISLTGTTTIKAIAYDGNESSVVATATYTYIDPNAPGTQNNPYTVAQARTAIDANTGVTNVYAKGVVSAIPTAWNSQYNNITFNFVDENGDVDFLQAYRCASSSTADASEVQVGDTVVVYGNLIKYSTTYEFGQGCQLISLTHPAVPVEAPTFSPAAGTYADAQTVTISCATNGATIYYTTDGTEPTGTSTEYTTAITVSTTTTIKAIAYVGTENSVVATATYHINSQANPYTVTEALAFHEYPANGIYVQGVVSTAPTQDPTSNGELTYYISADGTAGTDNQLEVYKGKGLEQAAFTAQNDIQVGDIVTVYGNVQVYNNTIEFGSGNYLVAFERPTTPYTLTVETSANVEIYTFVGETTNPGVEGATTLQVNNGTTVGISVSAAEGYILSLLVDGIDVTSDLDETGYYTFTMPTHNVTVSATAVEFIPPTPGTWVLTSLSDLTPDDIFVIVGTYEDIEHDSYALPNDKGTSASPNAVSVTIVDGTLSEEPAGNLQWNLSHSSDGYTFYPNGSNDTWLYCTNTNSGVRVGTNANNVFVLGEDGYLNNTATSRYLGIYNTQDWRCYTSNTGNSNIAGQSFAFYKKVETDECAFAVTETNPFIEDFEGSSLLPDCWNTTSDEENAWIIYDTMGYQSSHGVSTGLASLDLSLPKLTLPATSTTQLSFRSRNMYSEYCTSTESNSVLISTDNGQTFTTLWTPTSYTDNWELVGPISLAQYAGQTVQILFRYTANDGAEHHYWIVDDVRVEVAAEEHTVYFFEGTGQCDVVSLTGASIELPQALSSCQGWTFAGWATSPTNETQSAPQLLASPLSPDSDISLYAVYTDGSHFNSFPACVLTQLDVTEGFENYAAGVTPDANGRTLVKPNGWTVVKQYDPMADSKKGRPQVFLCAPYAHSGNYSLLLDSLTLLAMPRLADGINLQNVEMELFVRQPYDFQQIEVGVISDLTDPESFTAVATISNIGSAVNHRTVDFSNYSGNGRYIAFRNTYSEEHGMRKSFNYLDDITLHVKADDNCGITSLPASWGFEQSETATAEVESCWTLANRDGYSDQQYDPAVHNQPFYSHSSQACLRLDGRALYAMPEFLVGNTSIGDVLMELFVRQYNANCSLVVGVMTDANDPASFTPLAEISNNGTSGHKKHVVDFSQLQVPDGARFIAFRNTYNGSWGRSPIYIDDILLSVAGSQEQPCGAITSLPASWGFEQNETATAEVATCWTLASRDGYSDQQYDPAVLAQPYYSHSSQACLKLDGRALYAMPEFLVGNTGIGDIQMELFVRQYNANCSLAVGVMTDANDPASFTPLAEISNNGATGHLQHVIDFSQYSIPEGAKFIAFRNTYNGTWGRSINYIDDITISLTQARSAEVEQNGYEYTENDAANEALAPLGVDGFDINTFTVYPNPTSGALTLGMEAQRVEVNSLTGQKVAVFENTSRIDISNLPAGVYILKVTLPQGQAVRKIVKR